MLDWKRLTQPEFDRAVEAVLERVHRTSDPGCDVRAFDGRGGDGGRDVVVYGAEGEPDIIYQLKFFPEGFSNGFKPRRRQIKDSYTEAAALRPNLWVLVVPGNLTTSEDKWVRDLAKLGGPRVGVWGRARLDENLSRFPLLLAALTREPMAEALRSSGLERLALDTPKVTREAAGDLGARIAARSLYWGERVTIDHTGTSHEVYPLRPDAMEAEPINVHVELTTDADDDIRNRWKQFEDYGGGPLDLPAHVVSKVITTGPAWVAEEHSNVDVQVSTQMSREQACEIRVVSESGATQVSLTGTTRGYGPARRGMTVEADFVGGLTMRVRVPHGAPETTQSVPGEFGYDMAGQSASHAQRAFKLLEFARTGALLEMRAGQALLWSMTADAPYPYPEPDPYTVQLVSDLCVLENHFGVTLTVPASLSGRDRAEIRRCRLLLEGKCVFEPAFSSLSLTLEDPDEGDWVTWLSRDAVGLRATNALLYDVLGQKLELPEVSLFHTQLAVEDQQEVLAALRSGTAAGRKIEFRSIDGSPFRAYVPSLQTDPNARLSPVPLGLDS
jgi:hypothetical protein